MRHAAFVVAAWSVLLDGVDETGAPVVVVDHQADVLRFAAGEERDLPGSLLRVADVFAELAVEPRFRHAYSELRELIVTDGVLTVMRMMQV
ncbi:hypothetical protein KXS11_05845 [Plantibacter flavus]